MNMALRYFSEEDLICPVCCDVFVDPVVLSCGHNVCDYCNDVCTVCPVCSRSCSNVPPPVNLALRNLCETFLQERRQKSSSGICTAHNEKLKLFCLVDQEPVCLVCRDSRKHTDHRFCPTDEAVMDSKEKLKAELKLLQEKLRAFQSVKQLTDGILKTVKADAQDTERRLKKVLKNFTSFYVMKKQLE
ncbi:E3 ubiquitin-protein ligase TRIM35-like [Labeo rohita]|uniref:E3 ubiquitin-protein ligase TRIM35-like n=1 Tax=Labeo rohita TaxID=84645 RepID=UPI0021E1CDB2|nr:E3 ubiquitin-protein ligase TRIM35-like [Labeo rohita]